MVTLKPRSRQAQWATVEIGHDASIDVLLTPPTYAEFITELSARSTAEIALLRFNCITDWRGVKEALGDGSERDVPFDRDALCCLMQQYEPAFEALLATVRPLFTAIDEDRGKKSATPPTAATSMNPPSNASTPSDASPNSVTPSA